MNPARFLLELGFLKRLPRSGWFRAGLSDTEHVADHSFRVAFLAWMLALELKVDSAKAMKMALVHDLEEARCSDLDYVSKQYNTTDKEKAFTDVVKGTPLEAEATALFSELSENKTLEAQIVHDADQLELFSQAHEYGFTKGFQHADRWKKSSRERMQTKEAKKLADAIEKEDFTWWYK